MKAMDTHPLRQGSQAGMSMPELIVAATMAAILLAIGGMLFLSQLRGYNSISDQTRLQSGMKKALQAMVREISNTGGFLAAPRTKFQPQPKRLQLAYLDLNGRWCAEGDTATLAFYAKEGAKADTLMQDIRCNRAPLRHRSLVIAPGSLSLSFRYFDSEGVETRRPDKVRAVGLEFGIKTKKTAGMIVKSRMQEVRIQCVNL